MCAHAKSTVTFSIRSSESQLLCPANRLCHKRCIRHLTSVQQVPRRTALSSRSVHIPTIAFQSPHPRIMPKVPLVSRIHLRVVQSPPPLPEIMPTSSSIHHAILPVIQSLPPLSEIMSSSLFLPHQCEVQHGSMWFPAHDVRNNARFSNIQVQQYINILNLDPRYSQNPSLESEFKSIDFLLQ